MASTYLNLYNNATSLRRRGLFGSSTPYNPYGWGGGGSYNVFVAGGEANKVVHDTLNNKYYGTQTQASLIKGLQDSIKRTQGQLGRKGETTYSTGWMGALNSSYRNYSAKDRADQNARIKQQQGYLKHIMNGGYGQEGNDFFKSYDAYTPGWNNVFTSRYNNQVMTDRNNKQKAANAQMAERNRQQEARNRQIEARNKKVEGRNTYFKRGMATGLDIGNGSKAMRKPTQVNKDVSTGIQSKADKLTASLGIGRSGLGI